MTTDTDADPDSDVDTSAPFTATNLLAPTIGTIASDIAGAIDRISASFLNTAAFDPIAFDAAVEHAATSQAGFTVNDFVTWANRTGTRVETTCPPSLRSDPYYRDFYCREFDSFMHLGFVIPYVIDGIEVSPPKRCYHNWVETHYDFAGDDPDFSGWQGGGVGDDAFWDNPYRRYFTDAEPPVVDYLVDPEHPELAEPVPYEADWKRYI